MPARLASRSWTLTALVLVASAVLTLADTAAAAAANVTTVGSSTSSSVCAATTCKLTNGGTCNRTVGGCPICVEFQTASNVYTCTTVMKTTKLCPDGFMTCNSITTPSPSPTPTPSPSSSSSSAGSLSSLNATSASSDGMRSADSQSDKLKTASVETQAPETTVTTGSSDSKSSFPMWVVIGAGTVVGCIIAAIGGRQYATRKRRAERKPERDSDSLENSNKELGGGFGGSNGGRETAAIDFSDSVLNLNDLSTTPTTAKAAYVASNRSTTAAEGAVFLKSDSWQRMTTSRPAAASKPPSSAPPVVQPSRPSHQFRGSQHVKTLFLDDLQGPLAASQLTTEVAQSVRESADAFPTGSVASEWMDSGYFSVGGGRPSGNSEFSNSKISVASDVDDFDDDDIVNSEFYKEKISILGDNDDGGNNSGTTEFYSSKISVLGDHENDDDFLRRNSERAEEDKSVAKWKQKFYVEL